jgi:hypothetical protein
MCGDKKVRRTNPLSRHHNALLLLQNTHSLNTHTSEFLKHNFAPSETSYILTSTRFFVIKVADHV